MTRLLVSTPPGFGFRATATSHGWIELPPFAHDEAFGTVRRTLRLRGGTVVDLEVAPRGVDAEGDGDTGAECGALSVAVEAPAGLDLTGGQLEEVGHRVGRVFGLALDLAPFYELLRDEPGYGWVEEGGEGRLLRSPTVWEDLAKILLTTNTTWAGTRGMASRLTELGEPGPGGRRAFPTPERVASLGPEELDEHVRAGYRSPYLHELATDIAVGEIDVESWDDPDLPTDELYERVSALRGFGPYAAGTALKLLGRFDRLALDSVARATYAEVFNAGEPAPDAEIRARYRRWGPWRGLVLWMDVLRAHR